MYFSNSIKLRKLMGLLLALLMVVSMFAGCKKEETSEPSDEQNAPSLNLEDPTDASESTAPIETAPPVEANENMATVLSQLTVRSTPSKESDAVATLDAGTQVEILRRETVLGIPWGLIQQGWIVMDYVQMNVATDDPDDSTDATEPVATTPTTSEETIRGMVNVNGLNIREEASATSNKVGSYDKGDVVTILETKNGWGRTSKGWISMQYISTGTSDNTNNDDNTTGDGSTTVIGKGIVTATQLNIRASASTTGDRVGSYTAGDRVEILEKSGNWGRTSKGWISLDYVYQDGTTGTNTAKGIVTVDGLNIRSGPGTGYGSVGSLNSGSRVSILEQFTFSGVKWGCIDKGWISLEYVYIDGTGEDVQYGTVTGDQLNIRSGPGTGYGSVGTLNSGDDVEILYTVEVNGVTWGNIEKGWISLDYVDLD